MGGSDETKPGAETSAPEVANAADDAVEASAKKAPVFVGTKPRETKVPLEWPIEFDGKVYESITVRRCTGFEIQAYVQAQSEGLNVPPPMVDCPREVYEALDDDDLFNVDEVVANFLPKRFRPAKSSGPEASDK